MIYNPLKSSKGYYHKNKKTENIMEHSQKARVSSNSPYRALEGAPSFSKRGGLHLGSHPTPTPPSSS